MPRATLRAAAHHLPAHVVTRHELEARGVRVDVDWLERQAKSFERRWVSDGETVVSMAVEVARQLAKHVEGGELDVLILVSASCEVALPGGACIVAERAGLHPTLTFDMGSGCTAFLNAVDVADKYLRAGMKRVMIVASEIRSRVLPLKATDVNSTRLSTVFADGAGGVLLEAGDRGGILGGATETVPELWNRGIFRSRTQFGGEVLGEPDPTPGIARHIGSEGENRFALDLTPALFSRIARAALEAAHCTMNDMRWVVPHQPPAHMLARFCAELGISVDRCVANHSRVGNTSSASIPICLSELSESGQVTAGDKLLLVSVGIGAAAAAQVLELS